MQRSFLFSLGMLASMGLGIAWLNASPEVLDEGRALLGSLTSEESPVQVLLVDDPRGVAQVAAAVDPERIVALTEHALVLREGRVVATGPEAVGGPLTAAGWAERPIELWSLRPAPDPVAPGVPVGATDGASEIDLVALSRKPTLTPVEALAVLDQL